MNNDNKINGLEQDGSISGVLLIELTEFYTKPFEYMFYLISYTS